MLAEMCQPWHPSHSKAKAGAPCFLQLWIHPLWQRPLSSDWGGRSPSCSSVCIHLSILIFPAAEKVALNAFQNALPASSAWGGFPTKSSGFWICFQWWSALCFKRPRTDGIQPAWWLPSDPDEIISTKCVWFQVSWATFLQVCVIILPSIHAQKEDKFKGSHFSYLLAGDNTNISFQALKRSLWFLFQGSWPETALTPLLRRFLKSISDSY